MSDKNDIVMIELDRPRFLWYGHKALKSLCAMTGKKLSDFDSFDEDFDLEQLEKIMFCGLMKDAKIKGEDLKLEDMEDLLDYLPFKEIIIKLQEAFSAAFGSTESVGTEEKN